jgi:hypothetical protein
MSQWPLFSRSSHLPRALLWIAILLFIVLGTIGKPVIMGCACDGPTKPDSGAR